MALIFIEYKYFINNKEFYLCKINFYFNNLLFIYLITRYSLFHDSANHLFCILHYSNIFSCIDTYIIEYFDIFKIHIY